MYLNSIALEDLHKVNPYRANPTKWSNIQTIRWLVPTNCLSVFDHFGGWRLKE